MRFVARLPLILLTTLALGLPAARPAAAQTADLQTVKADSPDPVPPGGSITYDIIVTNAGPDDASGVTLTDTLPAGTTFLSLSTDPGWSCTTPMVGSGGTVDCSLSSLGVDSSAALTLTVAVDSGATPGTTIDNTATAAADEADPDEGNNDGSASTTVASPPSGADLSVSKVDDPDPVTPGMNLVYTVTVTNGGPDAATSVNLIDSLPPETTFVSLSSPGGWSCTTPAVGDGGDIFCSIASLGVGSAVFTLTVAVGSGVAAGTEIFNTATVSSSDDPEEGNDSGSASTTAVSPATLAGTKTVSGTFAPGGAVTYTVVLTNSGPNAQGDNPGDELTDVLPADLTLVGATATSGTTTATVATNTVTWNGALAAGASVTITIDAVIAAAAAPGTTISNQGTIAYDADGNGTNEASAVTDDPATPAADDPTSFQLPGQAVAIPALGTPGLAALAALLALGGAWVLRRLSC
ncbi:MAG TPA: DUF11 domain-containing protein [Acidobacteriota bacterium]